MLEMHTGEIEACVCKWMEWSESVMAKSLFFPLCCSSVEDKRKARLLVFAALEENLQRNNASLILHLASTADVSFAVGRVKFPFNGN